MARLFLLCLAAASCCLTLLLPPVQGRPGTVRDRDHRLLLREPHFDAAEPTEQQSAVAVKKQLATPSWSLPPAGGVVTPELWSVSGGANPLHNHVGTTTTRQHEERIPPPPAVAAAVQGSVSVVKPELRTTPRGANPLHN